jgi:hypothetical protein
MQCNNEHEHNSTQQQQLERLKEEEDNEVRLRGKGRTTWRQLGFQPRDFRRDCFEFDWAWDTISSSPLAGESPLAT